MAAFGLQADAADPARAPEKLCCLWPCNVRTFQIWQGLQTQWRISTQGREGLDYAGVSAYLHNVARVKLRDFSATFGELQAMEAAALRVWSEQRE